MIKDFAAIDFETANHSPSSICSVGIIIVRRGEIADRFYSLICPEPNYFAYWHTQIHGLTQEDTDSASVFPHVWAQIEDKLQDLPLVAHNSSFDEACLKAVFRTYGMTYPDYEFLCTLRTARRKIKGLPNYQLQTVAAYCGFDLTDHHNALADAEACAAIALKVF